MWCRFGIPKIILLGDAIANESLSAETRPAMVALSLSLSPTVCVYCFWFGCLALGNSGDAQVWVRSVLLK